MKLRSAMPRKSIKEWICRLQNEFSVTIADGKVVQVRMLRGGGAAGKSGNAPGSSEEPAPRTRCEIEEYIRGERKSFDVPVDISSLSAFSQEVLGATGDIPYGETRSYKWVAERMGRPRAVRAVGQALHRNPVPLLIP